MIGRLGAKANLALILGVARARSRLLRWLGIWPLTAVLFAGCAPSLATSAARSADGAVGAAELSDHCRLLSRTESALRYTSAGLAVLGGGSGLATIPAEDGVQTGLAVSAGIAAVGAVTTGAVRAEVAADFTEQCQ